jgi:hypothetical protein
MQVEQTTSFSGSVVPSRTAYWLRKIACFVGLVHFAKKSGGVNNQLRKQVNI